MKKISIALLTLSLIIGLTSCSGGVPKSSNVDSSKENSSISSESSSISSENSSTADNSEGDEAKVDDDTTFFKIGDTVEVGNWEIKVTKFKFQDEIKANYGSFSPEEGNKYLTISATITNIGEKADTFLPMFSLADDISCKVIYDDKYEYSLTNLLGHDKNLNNASINPLTDKKGIITFSLPNKVAKSDKSLTFDLTLDLKTYSFKLEKAKK